MPYPLATPASTIVRPTTSLLPRGTQQDSNPDHGVRKVRRGLPQVGASTIVSRIIDMRALWSHTLAGMRQWRYWDLAGLLAIGVLAAFTVGNDFGVTFEEERNALVGKAALEAYAGSESYYFLPALSDHGPPHFMFMTLTADLVRGRLPGWSVSDGRHLANFTTFLFAVCAFYFLCLRFVARTSAWMATALFATQPLLVGSGFINQKDTPFMALFLTTFVIGLAAGDRASRASSRQSGSASHTPGVQTMGIREELAVQWRTSTFRRKGLLAFVATACLLLALDFAWTGTARRLAGRWLDAAYTRTAAGIPQWAFDTIATDAHKTSLVEYHLKLDTLFFGLRVPGALAAILFALILACMLFPALGRPLGLTRSMFTSPDRLGLTRSSLGNPELWVSAVLLGATVSVRQLGLFVGVLVSLYWVARVRWQALFPLAAFWSTAIAVTVVTWPYLWPAPLTRLMESVVWATNFPDHRTFFEGHWISSASLPWFYFPKLAALQLTEPAVILSLIGLFVGLARLRSERASRLLLGLLALWLGIPVLALTVLGMPVYGNIRHLLFTLPAILVFAALSFDALCTRSRRPWIPWAVFGLAILPGVWALLSLHPYEYIYMNSFTGGVSGAYGQYELDRQCISLREGIEAANRIAAPGSVVKVPRQKTDVEPYASPTLKVVSGSDASGKGDFVLSCNWPEPVDYSAQGFHPVYRVQRGKAVLAVLWGRD